MSEDFVITVVGDFEAICHFDDHLHEIDRICTEKRWNRSVWSDEETAFVIQCKGLHSVVKFENKRKVMELGPRPFVKVTAMAVIDNLVLSGGRGELAVNVWNHRNGEIIGQIEGVPVTVQSIHCDQRRHVFVGGSLTATIHQFDLETRQWIASLSGHADQVCSIKSEGNLLYSCAFDGTARIWDKNSKSGTEIHQLSLLDRGSSLELSENAVFVGLLDGRIEQFDVRTNKRIRDFLPHKGIVRDISRIDEHSFVSVSDSDRKVSMWAGDGRIIQTITSDGANHGFVVCCS